MQAVQMRMIMPILRIATVLQPRERDRPRMHFIAGTAIAWSS
jgi:hypothetical protein